MVQSLIDALTLGSIYALAALGIGLIFSVMRLINFAHGDFVALSAFALLVPSVEGAARVAMGALPGVLLVPFVLLVGAAVAVGSELILFRRLRGHDPAVLMIGSFALGTGAQSLLLMLYGGRPIAINLWPSLSEPTQFLGLRVAALQWVTIAVTVLCLFALVLFLTRTRFGIAMRASAENSLMAQMLGVPAERIVLSAFALSGCLAGLTCLLLLPQTGVADIRMGGPIVMMAFVATVVGGLGSLPGSVAAGFLLGGVSVLLQMLLPIDYRPYRDALLYTSVIAVLLVRPAGLFARSRAQGRI